MKNFRIEFTEVIISGNVKRSTPWMFSVEECKSSKWFKKQDAKIITRNGK